MNSDASNATQINTTVSSNGSKPTLPSVTLSAPLQAIAKRYQPVVGITPMAGVIAALVVWLRDQIAHGEMAIVGGLDIPSTNG